MKNQRKLNNYHSLSLPEKDLPAKYLMLPALLLLSACGSGSGDNNTSSTSPVALSPVIDVSAGDNSAVADNIDTLTLQQSAARNAAQGITVNMSGAQMLNESRSTVVAGMTNQPSEVFPDVTALFSNRVGEQLFNDGAELGLEQLDTSALDILDGLFTDAAAGQTSLFVEASLGLAGSNNAIVQRNGNLITIDPDDAVLCDSLQSDTPFTASDLATCQQLVSNIIVELDAVTEQRGELSFHYSNQPLLSISYGPQNSAYTLNLGTMHQMERYAAQLSGSADDGGTAQLVQGSVRMQASVSNSASGQEAGTVQLEILDSVLVNYVDGGSLSMAPSLLMSLTHDDATGSANLEMALGAMELRGSATDPVSMSFGGFTARLDMDETAGLVNVSKLGFVNGPLRISDGEGMLADLTMQVIGFAFEEQTEQLVLNNAINIMLSATSTSQDAGNSSFRFNLAGPAGTRLDTSSNSQSATPIISGGPLQLDYSLSAAGNSETGFVSWRTDGCQSNASVPVDQSVVMSALGC